jgi:hypothetical protein
MPESVEAAREALWDAINAEARWIQAHGEGNVATRTRIVELVENEYPATIRAEERSRLLNPSPELVEAVARAMWRFDYEHGQIPGGDPDSPDGQALEEGDYEYELARAALQAAASGITTSP